MNFTSILPHEIPNFDDDVIFTTEKEAPKNSSTPLLFDDITEKNLITKNKKFQSKGKNGHVICSIYYAKKWTLSLCFTIINYRKIMIRFFLSPKNIHIYRRFSRFF
tara:strand:+ start:828 stop:1145 length:318 start_codon:yes stop_codon:yes gene_type:complete